MTTDIKVSIDVVNGLRAQLSNAQSELEYWKKRAELAEHFIDVDPLYMSKKDKEKWSEYTEHKNSNQ